MNNKPLVTVIMPFLNTGKFIQEAIESVFAQTYGNWELLLVDDGSTDNSIGIAKQYAEQNPGKVRYLEHDGHRNRGVSASCNLGVAQSKGMYIAFLDSDDVYLPHKLEQQVPMLDSQPGAAMLYGNILYWFSWTGNAGDFKRDFIPELGVQPKTLFKPPTLLPLFLRGKAAIPCPTSILVRRAVFDRPGGFEESFKYIYTDQAFYAKVCLKEPVLVAGECWAKYRQHPDASCAIAQRTGKESFARQFFLNWLREYLVDQKVTDARVWLALERELWLKRHLNREHLSTHAQYVVRWLKKWLLRLEELILPESLSRCLWLRGQDLNSRME